MFVNKKFVNRAVFSNTLPLCKVRYVPTTKNYPCVIVKYTFQTGSVIIVDIITVATDNASVLPATVGLKKDDI